MGLTALPVVIDLTQTNQEILQTQADVAAAAAAVANVDADIANVDADLAAGVAALSTLVNAQGASHRVKAASTSGVLTLPALANRVSLTAGSPAWAPGTYVQMHAGLAYDAYIIAAFLKPNSAGTTYQTAIATGAASAEVDRVVIHSMVGTSNDTQPTELPVPVFVPAGTRIAARSFSASAGAFSEVAILVARASDLEEF